MVTFQFSLLTLLLFLGFGQALTVSGILIIRHYKKKQGDNLLNILFFLTLYIYLTDLLVPSGMYRIVPFFMFTDFPVLFLIPPLLFLYVRKMTGNRRIIKIRFFDAVHFFPFVIIFIAHAPLIFQSAERKVQMFMEGSIPPPLLFGIDMTLLGLIQYFAYLLFCFFLVIPFRMSNSSDTAQAKKLRNILFFYLIIFFCLALSFYNLLNYKYYPQRDFSYLRLILDFPIIVICIYNYIILLSGHQPVPSRDISRSKYSKSGLTPEENEKIFQCLCRIIEEESLWTDPDMDLRGLAEKTDQTYHRLSQVINQTTGLNYHGFINRYRLSDACRLLEETDMTVLDIAFASGFNSKPTFNKVFKEEKYCTPTQYREKIRKKTSS